MSRKNSRILSIVLSFLLVFVVAFSGCGKKEASNSNVTTSPNNSEAADTQVNTPTPTVSETAPTKAPESQDTKPNNGAIVKVAYLSYMDDSANTKNGFSNLKDNTLNTLKNNGYIDGENIEVKVFNLEANAKKCPEILEQIKAFQPNLLLSDGTGVIKDIIIPLSGEGFPILLATDVANPSYILIKSPEAPGGNISGIKAFPDTLEENAYHMLNEVFPINGKKAVFITNGTIPMFNKESTAKALAKIGVELKDFVEVSNFDEYKEAALKYASDKEVGWVLNGTWTPIDKDAKAVTRGEFHSWTYDNVPQACITWWEANMVVGALMGLAVDFGALGCQLGDMGTKVLNGEDVSTLPIVDPLVLNIIFNSKRAEAMGIQIPPQLLDSAYRIYTDYEGHYIDQN